LTSDALLTFEPPLGDSPMRYSVMLAALLMMALGVIELWRWWNTPVVMWVQRSGDDTDIIQKALDNAACCNDQRRWYHRHCIVGLPPGEWLVNRPLEVTAPLTGSGR
jgi:hypothetical protein